MKNHFILIGALLFIVGIPNSHAQSCETNPKEKVTSEISGGSNSKVASNSGCTPSACRGAKTKFGEAKVISDLRLSLIDLKSKMENHSNINFNPRSYDIHGIIGETDDESLQIIKKEIEIIERELIQKLKMQFTELEYPENKAKQVSLLRTKLTDLAKLL
ncbi:MAG: hypothetical protein AAF361_09745 [Bacteroidota bacterium]